MLPYASLALCTKKTAQRLQESVVQRLYTLTAYRRDKAALIREHGLWSQNGLEQITAKSLALVITTLVIAKPKKPCLSFLILKMADNISIYLLGLL